MLRLTLAVLAMLALTVSPAYAMNLQITEIWAGGLDGSEYTEDWFEVTNFGESTESLGGLYYDDDSADPTKDSPLMGIDTIAPGESVIYVVDESTGISLFEDMWGSPNGDLSNVQIGYVDGSGLGGGGDAVYLFDGNTSEANLVATAAYSVDTQLESFVSGADGTWVENTFAANGVLGAYEGNLPATDEPEMGHPIGSPGVVPEPSMAAMMLGLLAAAGMAFRRSNR